MAGFCLALGMLTMFMTSCAPKEQTDEHGEDVATGETVTWQKQITEETIFVEGIEGSCTLLFLTDTHISVGVDGTQTGVDTQMQEPIEEVRTFENAEGVPSYEQFAAWVDYANEQGVDAVLLGGDIIDVPSEENIDLLRTELARLEMPYLYVNGNHDWTYPVEYMTDKAREEYLPLLEEFMPQGHALQCLDLGQLQIVGIDNSTNQVAAEALSAYEQLIGVTSEVMDDIVADGAEAVDAVDATKATTKPTIIVAHVPFMTQSVLARAREVWSTPVVIGAGNYGGIYPDEHSARFVELITAKDSPVELVLSGHVHFYDKDVINGEKDVLQMVGGAGFESNAILLHIEGK